MELTVMERMVVPNILPKEGSMLELVSAKNVREAIQFTEDELVQLKIVQEDDRVQWDPEAATAIVREIEFTGPQTKMIVDALQKLDREKKLAPEHLTLCEKFGIGGE